MQGDVKAGPAQLERDCVKSDGAELFFEKV